LIADLEVRFAMLGDGLLLIANHGPARAEKIRLELVRPLGEGEMPELLNRPRPFDLRADETKRIRFRVGRGHAQGVVCLAHWSDGSGPRSKQFDVDLMTP
jgi:hypothetical protein